MQAPGGHAGGTDPTDIEKYFDKQEGKWLYEDAASGMTYEYSDTSKTWEPTLESLQAAQAKAYSVTGVDESAPAAPVLAREQKRKKKDDSKSNKKQKQQSQEPRRNTAIYIEGLPLDVQVDEVAHVFSKAGIILGTPEPKIKLYEQQEQPGSKNGTGLVVFLQAESADIACEWFDGTPLRVGDQLEMKVTRAQFQDKGNNNGGGGGSNGHSSNSNAAAGPSKSKAKSDPEKAAAQRQAEKLKKKLEGWESDDEVEAKARVREAYREHKVVIFKHMFTLDELASDPTLLLDLKEDVREECETLGAVTNVVLYDEEPEGIMSVRFKEEAPAHACLMRMNGRHFGGRRIEAFFADSKSKYRKSKKGGDVLQDEEEEKQRLENFSQWLEGDDEDK